MEERTPFSELDISINRLSEDNRKDLSSFSCGESEEYLELNKFIQSDNLYLCDKYHYYSVYVIRLKSDNRLVGIFTLANDCIVLASKEDEEDLKEEVSYSVADEYSEIWNNQTSYPAINIGHLAIDSDYQEKHIGSIVVDIILGFYMEYDKTGCQFITVDSLNNERTNKFYQGRGFNNLTNSDMYKPTRRMYILVDSVREKSSDCTEE